MAEQYWDSFDCQVQCEEVYIEDPSQSFNETLPVSQEDTHADQ